MNDAQQEVSPDFVLMRLVSATEYHRLNEPDKLLSGGSGFGPVKPVLLVGGSVDSDSGGPSAGLGSASPHYSSPLPGRGELDVSGPPDEFGVAAQQFVDFPVQNASGARNSRAQLMVFQNQILRPPPRFLQEDQLESGPSTYTGPGPGPSPDPRGGKEAVEENLLQRPPALLQWHPVLTFSKGMDPSQNLQQGLLDSPHHMLTDQLAKWSPQLLDQALHLGLVQEPSKNCPAAVDQSVVVLAQNLDQLGGGQGEGAEPESGRMVPPSCEDPGDTSDALLVLEGLGSEEVGGLDRVVVAGTPVEVGSTLSGLMQQVHQLAEEAGVCTQQGCQARRPTAPLPGQRPPSPSSITSPSPRPQSRSQPQSRDATPGRCPSPPRAGEVDGRALQGGKSRKGDSLKVRLSKLFRTRSSGGGAGGLLDKRPSLASSNSSGGSLLDVWGSSCSTSTEHSTR